MERMGKLTEHSLVCSHFLFGTGAGEQKYSNAGEQNYTCIVSAHGSTLKWCCLTVGNARVEILQLRVKLATTAQLLN